MTEIRSMFLWLTSKTQPYGSDSYFDKILMDDYGFKYDNHKNLYKVINTPDDKLPTTMFCAHLDTVMSTRFYKFCRKYKLPFGKNKNVEHVFSKDNDFVKSNEKTTLGADDKAGVTVILRMIKHRKPGVYYLFKGEEVGRIGSKKLRSSIFENMDVRNVKKCISLDRRGYDSVITHQLYKRTCSDEFAVILCLLLNEFGFWYRPDPEGGNTDSVEFMDRFDECTNISVGYFKPHTNRECQDLGFLENLCRAFVAIDFESMTTHRKPTKEKTASFGFNDFSYKKYKTLLHGK